MTSLIIEARNARKMTQKQAGKLLGVSRQKYNKMESGKLTIEEFAKICNLFELHIQIVPKKYVTSL